MGAGAIAGIVAGVVALCCIVAGVCIYYLAGYGKKSQDQIMELGQTQNGLEQTYPNISQQDLDVDADIYDLNHQGQSVSQNYSNYKNQ